MTESVSKQFRKDQYFEALLTVVYRFSRLIRRPSACGPD